MPAARSARARGRSLGSRTQFAEARSGDPTAGRSASSLRAAGSSRLGVGRVRSLPRSSFGGGWTVIASHRREGSRVGAVGATKPLRGRAAECAALDQALTEARAGRSRVLVLRGEPGVGKTALLDYLAERATGCH